MSSAPRYLITTADERTWKFDRPVIFLGEWCRRNDRKHVWEDMDAIVAEPYGLRQREKDADYAEARALEDRLLPALIGALNQYHDVQYSERFWRIVLGHWVRRYVDVMLNRVKTLVQVSEAHSDLYTAAYANDNFALATLDSASSMFAFIDDRWNVALTERILTLSGLAKFSDKLILGCESSGFRFDILPETVSLQKRFFRWSRLQLGKLLSVLSRDNDAFILNSYLPRKEEILLQLALGQAPQLWVSPKIKASGTFDQALRGGLTNVVAMNSGNILEDILFAMVFELLPVCYLEGFNDLNILVKKQSWPKAPKFIFTSNSFDTDEVFKLWAAAKVELGSKYFVGQHGNNYGTHRYWSPSVEEVTADKFITWGWTDGLSKHAAAFMLKSPGRKFKYHNAKGGLLLIQNMYFLRINTWDSSAEYLSYFEDQVEFTRRLLTDPFDGLTIRLHWAYHYLNPSEDKMWYKINTAIKVDTGTADIWDRISESRLVIHAYDSTGILETLAQDIPTLAFWQNGFEYLRESAKPYYQLLVDAGIVHLTPQSAAEKVNEVWGDVDGWWAQSEVKEARRLFCDRYAKVSHNPVKDLKKELTADNL